MKISYLPLAALTAGVMFANTAMAADFKEGEDYLVIQNPETIPGKVIIVREFFWYGCPHCYKLEPFMNKWAKTKAADVAFFQSPAAMNPVWEASARGFYTAQLMGYQDKTHDKLFEAIQKDKKRLFDQNSLSAWYAGQGLDKDKFNSYYNSIAVNTRIARTKAGAKRYQLTGVPAVVVQGKYLVKGEGEKVPKVVDFLVDKVRNDMK